MYHFYGFKQITITIIIRLNNYYFINLFVIYYNLQHNENRSVGISNIQMAVLMSYGTIYYNTYNTYLARVSTVNVCTCTLYI